MDEILIQSKPNIIRNEQQAKAACCSPFFRDLFQIHTLTPFCLDLPSV